MGRGRTWTRSTVLVATVALVFSSALIAKTLSALEWDATALVGFGTDDTLTREYGEDRLGPVYLRPAAGHDGKYFFIQANDPWVVDPSTNASILDRPVYRSQRMLYPLLAGGFGVFGPATIVWSLLGLNVLGMAFGTLGASRLSRSLGRSVWWGLAFLGNLGLLYALINDEASILALAFAIWAVALLYEGSTIPAIGFLAAAALTREVMIVCAVGTAVWLWTENRRRHATYAVGFPLMALGIWEVYLRIRLGPDELSVGAFGHPFVGLARALPHWWDDPIVVAAGLVVLALSVVYVRQWWATRSLLSWAFVGFVPIALVLTDKVWTRAFDFTRALAPILTVTVLLVFVERGKPPHRISSERKRERQNAADLT